MTDSQENGRQEITGKLSEAQMCLKLFNEILDEQRDASQKREKLVAVETLVARRRIRSRSPYLVRRLHRYYEAVQLPVSVHRWITVSDLPSASSRAVFGVGPEVSSIEPLLIHTYGRGFLHIGARREHSSIAVGSHSVASP